MYQTYGMPSFYNRVPQIFSVEGQSAAEFSSNPDQTHLPVI